MARRPVIRLARIFFQLQAFPNNCVRAEIGLDSSITTSDHCWQAPIPENVTPFFGARLAANRQSVD